MSPVTIDHSSLNLPVFFSDNETLSNSHGAHLSPRLSREFLASPRRTHSVPSFVRNDSVTHHLSKRLRSMTATTLLWRTTSTAHLRSVPAFIASESRMVHSRESRVTLPW